MLVACHSEVRTFSDLLEVNAPDATSPRKIKEALDSPSEHLHDNNPRRGHLQKFLYSLYGLKFFKLPVKGKFRDSIHVVSEWENVVRSKSQPPIADDVPFAAAAILLDINRCYVGLAITMSFYGYLRINKVVQWRLVDICSL